MNYKFILFLLTFRGILIYNVTLLIDINFQPIYIDVFNKIYLNLLKFLIIIVSIVFYYNVFIEEIINKKKKDEIFKKIHIKHYLFQHFLKIKLYNTDKENECAICLQKFIKNKSKICICKCNHIFHFYCLKKYLINYENNNCPLCKYDLIKNIKYNFEDLYYTKIIPLDEKENPINEI
jgi:hypothetical protein